nr:PREDICTED: uncharacterized protein LOC109044638 isoform X1 [Bemisia tabaci]
MSIFHSMNIQEFLVICFCLQGGYHAHNILVFLPTCFWSHFMQVEPIFHALALRGHNMTVVSPFPPKKEIPNYRHIQLEADQFFKQMPNRNIIELTQDSPHALFSVKDWKEVADLEMPAILESAVFSDLVRGDSEFDLIFTELFFSQEALVVLGHIFKAPVVSYASFGYRPDILRFAGAPNAVAYLPYKELDYAGPMNLLQRLENALVQFGHMIYNEYWYYPQHDALLAKNYKILWTEQRME